MCFLAQEGENNGSKKDFLGLIARNSVRSRMK